MESVPSIARALDGVAPDLIVNAAAYTAVDRAEREPERAIAVNAQAPATIAAWCARHGAAFVHVSTDFVYSGAGDDPWLEDDAPGPLNVYGRSKLDGDRAVLSSGAACLVLRTSWVYAEPGRNFVTAIADKAQLNEELHVVADQVGAPTSAERLAAIIVAILRARADPRESVRANPGLVHASAAGEVSRFDLARAIIDGLRARGIALACQRLTPTATTARPGEAMRPLNSRLDLSRLKERYGIVPPLWRDDLEHVLDRIAQRMATRH
jgi:dTDP-4-dehydrorhamnose reductase